MAAEIPPDYFPTSPTLAGADCFPENMSVPAAGIFDTPSHIAIVNQDWVARILGVFDGLMYPEAWEAIGAETAYNELLELQAMLMTPANYLIPKDTFSIADRNTNLSAGNPFGDAFSVPGGERWLLQSLTIGANSSSMTQIRVQVISSYPQWDIIRQLSPVNGQVTLVNPNVWLNSGWTVRFQIINATAGDSMFMTASGLVYDEV